MADAGFLKQEIDKCVRCGACRAVCPTLRVAGRETASARGKLSIIGEHLAGGIDINDNYIKHIKECTLCGACKDNCPGGVNTAAVIQGARAEAVEKEGLGFAQSFIFKNIVDSTRLMPLMMKAASILQGAFFKDAAPAPSAETGLISRFSLPMLGGGRLLPELAKTFFLELPEIKALLPSRGPSGRRTGALVAAFYAGCGVNYLMPDVGVKSVEAVKRAGGEVIVPEAQVCCGMPVWSSGDMATAKSLALKNIDAFESVECDYIVTSCATCTYGLKVIYKSLFSDDAPDVKKRVEAFTAKVTDITELLAVKLNSAGLATEGGGEKRVVTYHDPCHLNRGLGIRAEPRELLKKNKTVEFKEMRFPCGCCGLGGGLSVSNYELSIEITRRKAESVKDSGAEVVATACPGCIVQLRDGLHRYGVDAKVVHVVELL